MPIAFWIFVLFLLGGLLVTVLLNGVFFQPRHPLHAAARRGKINRLGRLLQEGRKVNEQDAEGNTPLHLTAEWGRFDSGRLLIDHGASVKACNRHAETPLHLAAENGHLDICRLLLEHGAAADPKENEGRTPLHQAAEAGHVGICKLLLEHGADATKTESDGFTPFELARLYADEDALAALADFLYVPIKSTRRHREPVDPPTVFLSHWEQTDDMFEYRIFCWKPLEFGRILNTLMIVFWLGGWGALTIWGCQFFPFIVTGLLLLAWIMTLRVMLNTILAREHVRLDPVALTINSGLFSMSRKIPLDTIRDFTSGEAWIDRKCRSCILAISKHSITFGAFLPEQERLWMLEQLRQIFEHIQETREKKTVARRSAGLSCEKTFNPILADA